MEQQQHLLPQKHHLPVTSTPSVPRARGITFQGAPNQNQNPNTLHPLGM